MKKYNIEKRKYLQSVLLEILDKNEPLRSFDVYQTHLIKYHGHALNIYEVGMELSILKRLGLVDYEIRKGLRRYWFRKVRDYE